MEYPNFGNLSPANCQRWGVMIKVLRCRRPPENPDSNYQSGDQIHVDFVLNQFLSESFAVGVNGFFFRQLSGDSGEGAVLGPFKGEASGFGPAIYWIRKIGSRDVAFTLKWFSEFNVKNRLEGDHVFASFAMSF